MEKKKRRHKKRVQSSAVVIEVSFVSVKEAAGSKRSGMYTRERGGTVLRQGLLLCRREQRRVGFHWVWVWDQKSVEETRASHFSLLSRWERVKTKCRERIKTKCRRETVSVILFTLLDSQRRSVESSVRMTKKYSSSVLMSPDVTPDDCDSPPSPNEGHPHPDPPSSPESDCDSFVTSSSSKPFPASCVTRCPETRLSEPFQDISNKKQSTIKELVSIIRQGNWDELVSHLESKPNTDLNAFVNGNTVLHYCLMFGQYSRHDFLTVSNCFPFLFLSSDNNRERCLLV